MELPLSSYSEESQTFSLKIVTLFLLENLGSARLYLTIFSFFALGIFIISCWTKLRIRIQLGIFWDFFLISFDWNRDPTDQILFVVSRNEILDCLGSLNFCFETKRNRSQLSCPKILPDLSSAKPQLWLQSYSSTLWSFGMMIVYETMKTARNRVITIPTNPRQRDRNSTLSLKGIWEMILLRQNHTLCFYETREWKIFLISSMSRQEKMSSLIPSCLLLRDNFLITSTKLKPGVFLKMFLFNL